MARKKKNDGAPPGITTKFRGNYIVTFLDEKKESVCMSCTLAEIAELHRNKEVKITNVEFLSEPYYRPVNVTKKTLEDLNG